MTRGWFLALIKIRHDEDQVGFSYHDAAHRGWRRMAAKGSGKPCGARIGNGQGSQMGKGRD
jgi:hypothetical protein